MPALAASNGPVRALLREGSGPSAAVALYQHAVDAVPIKVRPTTLFTGQFYINTLKSTWLQLKLAIVNLANAENRYCCCVVLRLLAFLELFKSILAVKPSVCTHDSVCAHEPKWQLHKALTTMLLCMKC